MTNQRIEPLNWGMYFHQLPNVADEELDPYQYRLFGHYCRVAGGGGCWETVKTTALKCKMGDKVVTRVRGELEEMGYINIKREGDNRKTFIIEINVEGLIRRNLDYFTQNRSEPQTTSASSIDDTASSIDDTASSIDDQRITNKEKPNKKKKDIVAKNFENSDESKLEQNLDSEQNKNCDNDPAELNDLLITSVPQASNDDLFEYKLVKWVRTQNRSAGKKLIRKFEKQFKQARQYMPGSKLSALSMYENDVVFRDWCDYEYKKIHKHYPDGTPISIEDIVKLVTDADIFLAWQKDKRTAIENNDYDLEDADDNTLLMMSGLDFLENEDE